MPAFLLQTWWCWDTQAVSVSLSTSSPGSSSQTLLFFVITHPPAPRGLAEVWSDMLLNHKPDFLNQV